MRSEVRLTPAAATLLQRISKEHEKLVILLDDTSCCSNSNVMLRENEPSWPVSLLAEVGELRVFVNPTLEKSLKAERITIDALDFADDSLSLETDYGKRLIMLVEPAPTQLFLS
ncbi:MAG: DUF779 domain-containing protein [Candidatus Bathyarchaeia archaeon]